jgi:hypothetical protein
MISTSGAFFATASPITVRSTRSISSPRLFLQFRGPDDLATQAGRVRNADQALRDARSELDDNSQFDRHAMPHALKADLGTQVHPTDATAPTKPTPHTAISRLDGSLRGSPLYREAHVRVGELRPRRPGLSGQPAAKRRSDEGTWGRNRAQTAGSRWTRPDIL